MIRSRLVSTRTKYISLIGAVARREGCLIATGGSNNRARTLLVEAAWVLLRWWTEKNKALHDWAMRIAARRRRARACVALARKLAGILYAMWLDESEFDPQALRYSDAA
ncbi:MAG TPA: hypothetical protein VD835_05245 [Pyrinomonadaceae bacterium]|nr:hypothetical protein [Pyrinomonadaceae bacterium]